MPEDKVKKNKRDQKWKDEHRDRINLLFRMGTKDRIKAAANATGLSLSLWVQDAIDEKIKRDQDGEELPPELLTSLMQWLKNHNISDKDIIDCIKTITKESQE